MDQPIPPFPQQLQRQNLFKNYLTAPEKQPDVPQENQRITNLRTSGLASSNFEFLDVILFLHHKELKEPLQGEGPKQRKYWRIISQFFFVSGLNPEVPNNSIFQCNIQSK